MITESKFTLGDEVLQTYFPEAPAMRVVNVKDQNIYTCRYSQKEKYISEDFTEQELKRGFDEVINQNICKGDYVTHNSLKNSPVMYVVKDYNNENLFGCRYITNGVFYYHEFNQDELTLVEDDKVEEYLEGQLHKAF